MGEGEGVLGEGEGGDKGGQKALDELKQELPEKAERVGRPVLDQAKKAHDMAKQLLDKAGEAAGELGQSMLEEAEKHPAEAAQGAHKGLAQPKKDLDEKEEAAEKQIGQILDGSSAKA